MNHFYDLIETLPQGAAIMAMHFSGPRAFAMCGPSSSTFCAASSAGGGITHERHGHMNLREIHAHVPVRPRMPRTGFPAWTGR